MWIELSECNIKLLIPLIFPIFKRVQDLTKKLYIKQGYDDHTLFKTFRYYFAYLLAFIPLIIVYIRTKKEGQDLLIEKKEKNDEKLESKSYVKTETSTFGNVITDLKIVNTRKTRIKSYLFLGGLCLMALACYYYRYFFEKIANRKFKQSMGIFFNIGGYILFSYLILKQKLYLHSYVSMGIIAVLLIVLFIITIFYIDDKMDILKSLAYYFFYILLLRLYDVLKKKYMIMFLNTPYFMMVVIGIFGCVFVLIYDLISFGVKKGKEENKSKNIVIEIAEGFNLNIDGVGPAFALILDLIIQFIWNLGIWLTIYYLTPCHYFVSAYISEYIYYIKSIRESKEEDPFYSTNNIVIFSVFAFVNLCFCLVFNEVVILNFCKLDYNTKKRIEERQRDESKKTTQAQKLLDDDENEIIELGSQKSNEFDITDN